jgi:hypothetical protein
MCRIVRRVTSVLRVVAIYEMYKQCTCSRKTTMNNDQLIERENFIRAVVDESRKWYAGYDPKTKFEAKNAMGRLLINCLSFGKQAPETYRLFQSVDQITLDKFYSELDEKHIRYPNVDVVHMLVNYVPRSHPSSCELMRIGDPVKSRMGRRFLKRNPRLSSLDFDFAMRRVYMRYNTFDIWTQCWTFDRKLDAVPYGNPRNKTIELFGSSFNAQESTFLFGTVFPDVDKMFGGFGLYTNLIEYIFKMNKESVYFNVEINPPNVPRILDTLPQIARDLVASGNNVMAMFPHWTDHAAYIAMDDMFSNKKVVTRYFDMWTDLPVVGKSMRSSLFW